MYVKHLQEYLDKFTEGRNGMRGNAVSDAKIYIMTRKGYLEEINKDSNYNNYPERGPNDLEARIEDLLRINVEHHNLNAELRKEIKYLKERAEYYQDICEQLRKENNELRNMGKNFLNEHRNKGDM